MTTFSVVIPCLNGEATLSRQLASLLRSAGPALLEILVADNGSTDRSADIVAQFQLRDSRIRMIDASFRRGINIARNAGIRAASGEFILFVDADDSVDPGWFPAVERAVTQNVTLFGGGVERIDGAGRVVSIETGSYTTLWDMPWPIGANCGARRSTLLELGLFDEELRGGGDETDFFWRATLAGHRLTVVPEAVVHYRLRPSMYGAFRQHYSYGRSHVRLYKRFADAGMPRSSSARAIATVAFSAPALFSPSRSIRRRSIERLGRHAGRVRESVRLRVRFL